MLSRRFRLYFAKVNLSYKQTPSVILACRDTYCIVAPEATFVKAGGGSAANFYKLAVFVLDCFAFMLYNTFN